MIKRNIYLQRIKEYTGRQEIKLLTGVRHSGKTTLIMQFIDELKKKGINDENIIYIDFECLMYLYITETEEFKNILWSILERREGHSYIFLDELRNVKKWAVVCREIAESFDCDIYVIASSKTVMYKGFDADLCYSYVNIEIYPILFSEYLNITKGNTDYSRFDMKTLFFDYIRRGAFPAVYLMDEKAVGDYLKNAYSAIILKDVVQCNNLRDISHIDKIMAYLMSHIGETFSPKTINDYVRERGVIISVDTVYSILNALVASGIIYKVPRYDIKQEKYLGTQEKYYLCDLSMRSFVTGDFDIGYEQAMENILYTELVSRGFSVSVGKIDKYAIDFRAEKNQDISYLNCCYKLDTDEKIKEKFEPLLKIKDNYFKMVLSMDDQKFINKGGIINYPLINFLVPDLS